MEIAIALLFGLAVGSFLNVCIARMPLRESIVTPRSRCPGCRAPIAAYDNIPVLSWLLLGGRCRNCRKPISIRYPAVEALTAIMSVLIVLQYGLGKEWFTFFVFGCAMIVLAFIDADYRILPDRITLNGIWVGLLVSLIVVRPSPLVSWLFLKSGVDPGDPRVLSFGGSLLGAILGGGLLWAVGEAFYRVRGIEGLGFGDVKMMAMVGAFLGVQLTLFTILVGSLLGSIIGIVMIRFLGKSRNYELPYGTFLAFGAVLAVLCGDWLIKIYLSWFDPQGTIRF
jgi:leader peptidase (prepilin peptidase)/N-methyltransferase